MVKAIQTKWWILQLRIGLFVKLCKAYLQKDTLRLQGLSKIRFALKSESQGDIMN
eukprot:c33175_g1_i1 orf=158-322(+)